eukprot:2871539-Rhodomonas_salina.1
MRSSICMWYTKPALCRWRVALRSSRRKDAHTSGQALHWLLRCSRYRSASEPYLAARLST